MGKARLSGGEILLARLGTLKLSQLELADRLGVSTASVCRWISGERTPSLEMALLLETELCIPVESWLLIPVTGTDG
jgi:plasmid maintenance system antidote protein VapI